jgi:ATP-dependent RNA helicase SUPV3L1/SUV3
MKNNGVKYVFLGISEIKQIAGRAGRYKTAHQAITQSQQNAAVMMAADPTIGLDDTRPVAKEQPEKSENKIVGYVTTLEQMDFKVLKNAMGKEATPIRTAGLFPPSLIVERFANYFPPGTPFSYILLRLHEISVIHRRFHLCRLKDHLAVADAIHEVRNLSIQERLTICQAPTNMAESAEKEFLQALATCIANNEAADLLELPIPLAAFDGASTPLPPCSLSS